MVKRKRKGVLSLSCGTRDRGGGVQIEIFKASNAFFPFHAELATGGGVQIEMKIPSKYAPNVNAFEKFYWPMNDLDTHKQKCPFIFAKMRKFRLSEDERKGSKGVLSLWERGPFAMGKGSFQFGKGVLLRGPRRLFFSHRKGVPGHGKGVPGPSMTNVIRALPLIDWTCLINQINA